MGLPRAFFAPSFRHRHLGTFLSAMVGVLAFLATFVMAAEASLSAITLAWDGDLKSRLTVEIPAVDDESNLSQADRVKQALAILHAVPAVAKATPLPDNEAARLLQPWIADAELLKALPVPSLIDVERKDGASLTADDLSTQLHATLRDARVDDHAEWLGDLVRFVRGITAFGGLMIGLATLTLVLAVNVVCRAIMATERETVSLLHLMGAEDNDIAVHFENHVRNRALYAASLGALLALLFAAALLYALRNFANPAVLGHAHWAILAVMVAAVPLVAVWVSSLSARLAVLGFLRTMP